MNKNIMINHEWIVDNTFEKCGFYENMYFCKKCKIQGVKFTADDNIIHIYWHKDKNLTCEEIIIKNILE